MTTLAETLAESAAAHGPEVTAVSGEGGAIEYRSGDRVIAVLESDGSASFRLDAAVAAAARRTPDTAASKRGSDWVRFAPATLDGHAIDRARAWFGAAARRAGPG